MSDDDLPFKVVRANGHDEVVDRAVNQLIGGPHTRRRAGCSRASGWIFGTALDDGRKVYIEFPRGIAQGEMPPLLIVGPDGNTSKLVN